MTLRTRLLISFIALGAVPLMVVGWVTSRRNIQAVKDLVAGETRLVARRVSEEIEVRYDVLHGEVLFLAGNMETRRLFGDDPLPAFASDPGGPKGFLEQSWGMLSGHYRRVQFHDAEGREVFSLPPPPPGTDDESPTEVNAQIPAPTEGGSWYRADLVVLAEVKSTDGGRVLGRVSAAVEPGSVLPGNLPERGFGEEGFVALIDTETERVLYHPQVTYLSQPFTELVNLSDNEVAATLDRDGTLEYSQGGEDWVGFLAPVRGTSWAVLSSSPLGGFSRPFRDAARANLLLVMTITVLAAGAFLLSTLTTTRSLVLLTHAAKKVAAGDLDPGLPPGGRDEVGTLTGAFQTMLGRIRRMIREVEESRQMAAVGEFSAQIAHELRNPLTAIRMSLQGLSRKLGDTEHGRPLEIALQETDRLDRVASGVLTLGRRPGGQVAEVSPVTLVEQALQTLESEFRERKVNASVQDGSSEARIEADGEALKGALINLLRNAMEAMPDGGTIEIVLDAKEGGPVAIQIKDQGPGVPPELADRIFDPFVTTKDRGNGFGLPLALRAVEANGGRLRLLGSDGPEGAHFAIELPTKPSL